MNYYDQYVTNETVAPLFSSWWVWLIVLAFCYWVVFYNDYANHKKFKEQMKTWEEKEE